MDQAIPLNLSAMLRPDCYHTFQEYLDNCPDPLLGSIQQNPIYASLTMQLAFQQQMEKAILLPNIRTALVALCTAFVPPGYRILAHYRLSAAVELLLEQLPCWGIRVDRADFHDLRYVAEAITSKTKLLFTEFPSLPYLDIINLSACSELAHKKQALFVVDHSLIGEAIKPKRYSADLVMCSGHWLTGQGDLIAYIAGSEELIAFIENMLSFWSNSISNESMQILQQGLVTYDLRMSQQSQNAYEFAKFFLKHPKISQIFYPNIEQHLDYTLARQQLSQFGNILICLLNTNTEGCIRLLNHFKIAYISTTWGTAITTVEYISAMSYLSLNATLKNQLGIFPNIIQISIGLEPLQNLLRDFEQALRQV